MKILVTGASGFIGANLCIRLLKEGHQVHGLDNFYSSERSNMADFENDENFQFTEHDIIEPIPADLGEFDQIYHLACPASPPRYQKNHIYTLRVSFDGTRNLLEFARQHSTAPTFFFTSTSECYGDPLEHPQKESYRGNVNPHGPRSCYDEGKRVAESLCMNYHLAHKIPMRIIRIFNTYGPYMDADDGRVVSNFIIQALQNHPITIHGDGSQTRSFQYIDDLIDGMVSYMNADTKNPGPINMGNPDELTIKEFAETVLELIPESTSKLSTTPEFRTDDPMRRCPDITLAKEILNWQPKLNLREGLARTIEYFKK